MRTLADTRTGTPVGGGDLFEALARAGLVARGSIYALIGILAAGVAVGAGGKTTNQQGALRTVAQQPFGKVLLGVLAVGLGGYALWRLTRAIRGRGRRERDGNGARIVSAASGAVYAALCFVAVSILAGSGSGSGSAKHEAGGVLGWPAGQELVGLVGAGLLGVAAYQAYKGLSRKFADAWAAHRMSAETRRWLTAAGVFGHVARGVVFALTGVFLLKAAIEYEPQQAVGLDGALAKLAHAGYGPLLLGTVAAGLISFGIYSGADARYREV